MNVKNENILLADSFFKKIYRVLADFKQVLT